MKIKDIMMEWPFDMESDYKSDYPLPKGTVDNTTSLEGLRREKVELGTLTLQNIDYHFWQTPDTTKAMVTTKVVEFGKDRQQIACTIDFNLVASIPDIKNPLQVSMVYTHPTYRNIGLSWMLYIVLCKYGYTVISDYTQYNGGKAIWKKMASMAEWRKFVVRIWSDKINDWLRTESGEIIKYDSANIPDDSIWDSVFGNAEKTTLFVLQKN